MTLSFFTIYIINIIKRENKEPTMAKLCPTLVRLGRGLGLFVDALVVALGQRVCNGQDKVANHDQDQLFKNPAQHVWILKWKIDVIYYCASWTNASYIRRLGSSLLVQLFLLLLQQALERTFQLGSNHRKGCQIRDSSIDQVLIESQNDEEFLKGIKIELQPL